MSKEELLIRWYNINKVLPTNELNSFWIRWEKSRLTVKRLQTLKTDKSE